MSRLWNREKLTKFWKWFRSTDMWRDWRIPSSECRLPTVMSVTANNFENWSAFGSDGVETYFPRQRHLQRHRYQDTIRTRTFRIRLKQDETETSFKLLETRNIPRHRQQNIRRTKTLRIRLRRDWYAVKMFETETLPKYSYQDTLQPENNNNHKNNRFTASK